MASNNTKKVKYTKIKTIESAEPGDLIEFIRGRHYSHWGIFVGDNMVVHRWGENDGVGKSVGFMGSFLTFSGATFDKATILQSKIDDVLAYGGKIQVNNYLDDQYEPRPVKDILDSARRCLNSEGYNLVFSNCEHFATECRYGEPNSRQVRNAVWSFAGGAALVGLALAGIAFMSSRSNDENKIKDVEE